MSYELKDFTKDVIEKSYEMPVMVDFWAEWCGPCKVLGPVLEELAKQQKDKWVLVKLDTEQHQELSIKYGIRSIPNVKLFIDGEVKDEFVGALPKNAIEKWLEKAIPSKFANQLKDAENLLVEGETEKAKRLLQEIVTEEPSNLQAKILLARGIFFSEPQIALELVSAIEPGSDYFEAADAIKTLVNLINQSNKENNLSENAAKEDYIIAVESLQSQDYGQALEQFIKVMAMDRSFDDDGARKACIAIFKFLGENSEVTKKYRSAFSSALYI